LRIRDVAGFTRFYAQEGVPRRVDTVDSDRAAFVERYFHMQWPNRSLYHAMLNTAPGDAIIIHTTLALKKVLELPAGPTCNSEKRRGDSHRNSVPSPKGCGHWRLV